MQPHCAGYARASEVAVIVVNFNAGPHLGRCLAALDAQRVAPGRVLVVDNASVDESIAAAEQAPAVEVLRLDHNAGFAGANNRGVALCQEFAWIALLNPDAFPEPDWLERMLAAINGSPQYQVFGAQLVDAAQPERLDGSGDVYHVSGLAWRRQHGAARVPVPPAPLAQEIFSPCAAAAIYPRQAWQEAGGFDEDFFCYFEDVDLGFRLRLLGYRCAQVPAALVHHVGSATTGRRSDFSLYYGHRNLLWTFVRNMPPTLLLRYLPQHLWLTVMEVVHGGRLGKTALILRAKRDAVRGLRRAWRKRRATQRARRVGARALQAAMRHGWLSPYLGGRQ